MMSSGISNLVNFDISGLEGTLAGTFGSSTKLAARAAAKSLNALTAGAQNPNQVEGMLQNAPGSVESAAKDVTSEVKSAASAIKNKLRIPF
jgi:hypothetical protein